jgi:hypothetical protein
MITEAYCRNCSTSECARGLNTNQGEHAAVVVWVWMDVKKAARTRLGEGIDDGVVTPLADVDDAFEHPSCIPKKRPFLLPSGT